MGLRLRILRYYCNMCCNPRLLFGTAAFELTGAKSISKDVSQKDIVLPNHRPFHLICMLTCCTADQQAIFLTSHNMHSIPDTHAEMAVVRGEEYRDQILMHGYVLLATMKCRKHESSDYSGALLPMQHSFSNIQKMPFPHMV